MATISNLITQAAGSTSGLPLGDIGSVISASTVVNIVNADGTPYTPPEIILPDQIKSTTILLAIIFSAIVGAILIAVGLFFLIRKIRMKKATAKVYDISDKEMEMSSVIKEKDLVFAEIMPNSSMDRIDITDNSPPKSNSPRKRVKRARVI